MAGVCLAAGAFVNWVNPSVSCVARTQPTPAMPTQKQPLQEGAAFARGPTGTLLRLIGLVAFEHSLVFQVVVPVDVTGMVLLDQDQPGVDRQSLHSGLNLSFGRYGFGSTIPTEDVGSGVGRIAQKPEHPSMLQLAPDDLPTPNPAVSAPRKTQVVLQEVPNDPVRTACLAEKSENQSHGIVYFGIRIKQHTTRFIAIDITDRQRETQFSALGLVGFTALEARADKMQFGLRHGSFEAEQELVVEIGRIVAAIRIDN